MYLIKIFYFLSFFIKKNMIWLVLRRKMGDFNKKEGYFAPRTVKIKDSK